MRVVGRLGQAPDQEPYGSFVATDLEKVRGMICRNRSGNRLAISRSDDFDASGDALKSHRSAQQAQLVTMLGNQLDADRQSSLGETGW